MTATTETNAQARLRLFEDAVPAADRLPDAGGLPQKEPEILARWERMDLYERLRESRAGPRRSSCCTTARPTPTATSTSATRSTRSSRTWSSRSQQMLGKDANYVPGWDCHGLPIEWKIEEQYRDKDRNKDEVPVVEFRARVPRLRRSTGSTCSARSSSGSGVVGDWDHPYSTMDYPAEATIVARDLEVRRRAASSIAAPSR